MFKEFLEQQQRMIRGYQRAILLMLVAGINLGISIQGFILLFAPWLSFGFKLTANILCLGGSALVIFMTRREIKRAKEFLK